MSQKEIPRMQVVGLTIEGRDGGKGGRGFWDLCPSDEAAPA